jgi:hypothetical protein
VVSQNRCLASADLRKCNSSRHAIRNVQLARPGGAYNVYEVRPRKDHRGVDLISDVLPFGRLWYDTPDHVIGYAMHSSRSHHAVIRVYDAAGNVIETHEHKGDVKAVATAFRKLRRTRAKRAPLGWLWSQRRLDLPL